MSKQIEIEYCGQTGLGAPAGRLKKSIQDAYPGVTVVSKAAEDETNKIEVCWNDGGQKQIVWSKNKVDT